MWIEAILAREDFVHIVDQLLPMQIAIGDNGDHLSLHDPLEVALVPNEGVRLGCKASIRYTVVGIAVPIVIHAVKVLLRPAIEKREGGKDALVFSFVIEDADLAGIPAFLDTKIREKVNEVMKTKRIAFSWEFGDMLTQTVKLPATLQPLDSLSLDVAWGKFRVTDEAFVMAISFHSTVARDGGGAPLVDKTAKPVAPIAPIASATTNAIAPVAHGPSTLVLGGAALAIALGGAYLLRAVEPRPRLGRPRNNASFLSTFASMAATSAVLALGATVWSRAQAVPPNLP